MGGPSAVVVEVPQNAQLRVSREQAVWIAVAVEGLKADLRTRMSTKWHFEDVRTRVDVGSSGGEGICLQGS